VRLEYETVRDGRRWSAWDFWFDAMNLRTVAPASTLYFPQYDQEISAAIEGSGVAMGVLPHVMQHLREGVLFAPLGSDLIADWGIFFVVRRPDVAGREAVEAFVAWLKSEVRRDGELTLAVPRGVDRSPGRRVQAAAARSRARRS
jgi:DNA-binding transcriptional LysR family regulator